MIAGIGAAIGDGERIAAIVIDARLESPDGDLEVHEVIDYDFGARQRRGIFRTVPDLAAGAAIDVSSASAPDDVLVTNFGSETRIRIGDPDVTVSNRHRYEIGFVIDGAAVANGNSFVWQAVGTEWTVGIEHVEVRVAVPYDSASVRCASGNQFDPMSCEPETLAPGLLSVTVDHLAAGEGVELTIVPGGALEGAPAIGRAVAPLSDPGSGIGPPVIVAALAALVASIPAAAAVRYLGREQVWSGGAVAAAFGGDGAGPVERLSESQMAELTTIEFEAPRDMSAVEGALIVDERVRDRHLTAWMLESAIRGEIDLTTAEDDAEMRRGTATPAPTVSPILATMFDGRQSVELDAHDDAFRRGWGRLRGELQGWLREADHWDPSSRSRRAVIGLVAFLLFLGGGIVTFFGGWFANRSGTTLIVVAAGAVAFAIGVNVFIRFWELHVRTPTGSAGWLQVESFRRFLHESEADHVEYAASRGLLRQYTAWAVALDETDAWTDAVRAAAESRPDAFRGSDLAFAYGAGSFVRAASVASTKPSSSGGSSGFSGGGGGFSGGGGGGGGSW